MARQAAIQTENNFRGGLVTEASGLNFPENACTETWNCVFSFDGSVQRRLGLDYEPRFEEKIITRNNSVITTYVWKNVTGNGNLTLLVAQVGSTLYFYTTTGVTLSDGALTTTVNLNAHAIGSSIASKECQFADGNGYLFVAHPQCAPLRIEYNSDNETVTATEIEITIRDFEGLDDGLEVDERPKPNPPNADSMDPAHHYNLQNQGWEERWLEHWTKKLKDNVGAPSNCDIQYLFKNADEHFLPGGQGSNDGKNAELDKHIMRGNTPAPKGHFILPLWNQNRTTVSHIAQLPDDEDITTSMRPSTTCFFAGRIFWAGINHPKINSRIYFSQIVERDEQYGQCYQANDPTAEDVFDLLPSDGGVIAIPEAGTVYKIFTITGGVAVFAANGIWIISGSTGIGFTAKDFTVTKITAINAISASSFVDIAGNPAWWNAEGIYILTSDGQNPSVKSLTDERIKKFYQSIPTQSKIHAKGFFSLTQSVVQWLFKSENEGNDIDNNVEYDSVLNFNMLTTAFYPWTFNTDAVKIHALCVFDGSTGSDTFVNVTDRNNAVVTEISGDNVDTMTTTTAPVGDVFKYFVSRRDDNNDYNFTFAETRNTDYVDWAAIDPIAYVSYFISGYKLHGQGIKKFQANWIRMFSRNDLATKYRVQGVWDFANTPSGTGRWSIKQLVQHDNDKFDNLTKRLKVRGHGLALQIRVESVAGEPFDILGWSLYESGNGLP